MAETELTTPHGVRMIVRPHTPPSSPLRAWSAADVLVLNRLGTSDLGRVLIVNDEFGALSVGLASHTELVSWGDSALSRAAIAGNLERNGFEASQIEHVIGSEVPTGSFDTVIVRLPKTTALLDYQLGAIRHVVSPTTRVIGTGMARHIQKSTTALFEKCFGPTTTSRATQKARLIHVEIDVDSTDTSEDISSANHFETDRGVKVADLPGVFSAGHVDVGSALLLDVLTGVQPPTPNATVVDLGCGNGLLAATVAMQWPTATFELIDVSDMAIAAAKRTWSLNELDVGRCGFRTADGLDGLASESIDVVLTNPPFHQGHATDSELTDRLLADAARVLKPGGVAYVVVQRHLRLHNRMKQWFSSVEPRSKHPSHVVLVGTM